MNASTAIVLVAGVAVVGAIGILVWRLEVTRRATARELASTRHDVEEATSQIAGARRDAQPILDIARTIQGIF